MTNKVIHIWNTAGIGGLLSRYMDRYYDYESVCIVRLGHDPFKLSTEKCIIWDNRASIWLIKCVMKCLGFDIIHLHGGIQWLKYFRFFYPNKKIVLHLHGSKIRNKWSEYNLKDADVIIVATPDLLNGSPEGTIYLPNLVDEQLIREILKTEREMINGYAFHVARYAIDKAKEYANKYNLKINWFDRDKIFYNHYDFLSHLSQFEFYIDVKRGFPHMPNESNEVLKALSVTGLEALKLGLKVINWKGEIIDAFPSFNDSKYVCSLLNDEYLRLFEDD